MTRAKFAGIALLLALFCHTLAVKEPHTHARQAKNFPLLTPTGGSFARYVDYPGLGLIPSNLNELAARQLFRFPNLLSSIISKKDDIYKKCGTIKCGPNTRCRQTSLGNFCECRSGYVHDPNFANECISPCSLANACGKNTYCFNDDGFKTCICKSSYFPISRNSESTLGCSNSCSSNPCNTKNTVCTSISATTHTCICQAGFLPIRNNAEANGCHRICGTALNAVYIVENGYCLEVFSATSTVKSWEDARDFCQSHGGDLAILDINDQNLETLLEQYFPEISSAILDGFDDLYIGAQQTAPGGGYEWLDGRAIPDDTAITNWNVYMVDRNDGVALNVPTSGGAITISTRGKERPLGWMCQYNYGDSW